METGDATVEELRKYLNIYSIFKYFVKRFNNLAFYYLFIFSLTVVSCIRLFSGAMILKNKASQAILPSEIAYCLSRYYI